MNTQTLKNAFKITPTLCLAPLAGFLAFWSGWQMIPELQFFVFPCLLIVSYHGNALDILASFICSIL